MIEKEKILSFCNAIAKGNLMETLEIEFVDVGDDFLAARMPVTQKVYQPDGILHGGASVALAETVGSAAVAVFNRNPGIITRGIEISANHLKSVRQGHVTATARSIHLGKTTQLWQIKVTDDDNNLISLCKLTTITLEKR
tara:strand:- start:189 stop:608 length:420 start_codon:yes stop_codon:yes gene_type:complete